MAISEAGVFKALSDPLRVRIMGLLVGHEELCVCHLADALGEPQFKVSKHLAVLKNVGLVTVQRRGTWMYYRVIEKPDSFLKALFDLLNEQLVAKQFKDDRKKLVKSVCQGG